MLAPILLPTASAYDPSFRREGDSRAIVARMSLPLQQDAIEALRLATSRTEVLLSMIDRSLDDSVTNDWIVTLDDYVGYANAAFSTHVLADVQGSWAVLTSWDDHALVGGDPAVVEALRRCAGLTADASVRLFLDQWQAEWSLSGGARDVSWIRPLIGHMITADAFDLAIGQSGDWLP